MNQSSLLEEGVVRGPGAGLQAEDARPLILRLTLTSVAATLALWPYGSTAAGVGFTTGRDGKSVRWTLAGSSDRRCQADGAVPDRIVCEDVYPGIRLTLDGGAEGVTYRFDFAPGVEPSVIRMRYDGVEEVTVKEGGGALRIHAGGRALREDGLRCYQETSGSQREVSCAYRVARVGDGGYEVAFDIAGYDHSRGLVVDPIIAWSSYLGGYWGDVGYGVAADGSGNVYVTGSTWSSDFPTSGGFDGSLGGVGTYDAFVTKVDASGSTLAWSSYLGGSFDDKGYGIAVDGSGNVYVTGSTESTNFPTSGGFDTSDDGFGSEAFLTKVDASGSTLAWSSYLGGSHPDVGYGVAVDGSGNVYVTGSTTSSDFPVSGGFDTSYGGLGLEDAFVTKVDASGSTLAWSSYLGGSDYDEGYGIAIDGSGNVYVTGSTKSSDFPASGGVDTSHGGGVYDAFVTKVDASGSTLAWSSYLGGSAGDGGKGIAVDGSGSVYVIGGTNSFDFPTSGGFGTSYGGSGDAFVTKVDASGSTLAWSSFLGGNNSDEGSGVAVDGSGNVYVTGWTRSPDFPTSGGFDTSYGGVYDAFVAKVNAAGSSLAWSSYLGGSDYDVGQGIAVDGSGTVYVTGSTSSADFPTSGGFDTSLGISDAFVTRIQDTCGNGACDPFENPCNCPADCGADACGNSCCGPAEDQCNCAADCGPDTCGNGCCGVGEDPCTCPADCLPFCGDGFCCGGEDTCNCALDCGPDSCGNGCCGPAEDECSCPADCADVCGNGCCGPGEDACGCPADCGADTCGNSCCGPVEDECSCPADCADVCGNGCCGPGENPCTCSLDCGPDSCGNSCCGAAENPCNCPSDCVGVDICGDNCCSGDENQCTCLDCFNEDICGDGCCYFFESPCTCPSDCSGRDRCGDHCCSGGETSCNCADDCGADTCGNGCCGAAETPCGCAVDCGPVCGDGCCTGAETCATCAMDCGSCPDMGGRDVATDGPQADVHSGTGSNSGCACALGQAPTRQPALLAWLLLALGVVCRVRDARRAPRTALSIAHRLLDGWPRRCGRGVRTRGT
jgi:beta-propeller repeat-containing protein